SPSSRRSMPPPRHICDWRGSWSHVAPSPESPEVSGVSTPSAPPSSLNERGQETPPVSLNERDGGSADGFRVSLGNFDGPFDLLLNLISKHEMDITEVS